MIGAAVLDVTMRATGALILAGAMIAFYCGGIAMIVPSRPTTRPFVGSPV